MDDLEAVDILLLKGYQEFQETINAWKMDSHLMRLFNEEEVRYTNVMYLRHVLTSILLFCSTQQGQVNRSI